MIIIVVNYNIKVITGYYLLPISYLVFILSTTESIHLIWYLMYQIEWVCTYNIILENWQT